MPQPPSAAPSPMSFNLGRPAPSGIQRLFKEPLQFTPVAPAACSPQEQHLPTQTRHSPKFPLSSLISQQDQGTQPLSSASDSAPLLFTNLPFPALLATHGSFQHTDQPCLHKPSRSAGPKALLDTESGSCPSLSPHTLLQSPC